MFYILISTSNNYAVMKKLSELKKEKGLVAELFRDFLSNLTDEEIENARLNLEVE